MTSLGEIKLFLLDMDGTIYLGDKLFPSVTPFLKKLRDRNIEYLFLTNNSSRDKTAYLEKLTRLGVPADSRHLMTSGDAAIDYLQANYHGKSVFLAGTAALARSFLEAGISLESPESADIAVAGFDTELTYEKLRGLYRMAVAGKPYICTHPDLLCPAESGFVPDLGATIAYIKAAAGREPDIVIGKPERYLIDAASSRFSVPVEQMVMVGDRLYTDIEMAVRAGAVSVLVLTGETSLEDAAKSSVTPDYIMSGLDELSAALG